MPEGLKRLCRVGVVSVVVVPCAVLCCAHTHIVMHFGIAMALFHDSTHARIVFGLAGQWWQLQ
jgi:hypothetical protein